LSLFAIVRGRCEEHTDANTMMRMGRETLVLDIGDMVDVG
jgi:hypothetical protein